MTPHPEHRPGPVLVLSPRATGTDRALVGAAHRRDLAVHRMPTWRVPADLVGTPAHLYAGPLFADAVTRDLGIGVTEAPAAWIADLPSGLTLREITATTLEHAWGLRRPLFVKPPKIGRAHV